MTRGVDHMTEVRTESHAVRLQRSIRIGVICLVIAPRLAAQADQRVVSPMVFIEAFRSTDAVGRKVAIDLREALAQSVSPARLVVMPTAEIDAFRNSGEPDEFGSPWNWTLVREMAHTYRATCAIDLLATSSRSGITVAVARLCAPFEGDPARLESVTAPTAEAAVAVLAKRLASDSALFVEWVRPAPPPLPPVDSSQLGRYRVRVRDSESGHFLAMGYELFTPPYTQLLANMRTAATADGWGLIRYEEPGDHAIDLNAVVCGKDEWLLVKTQRKFFAITRGELTSVEFVVRKSTLRMAKMYYNPEGRPCPIE